MNIKINNVSLLLSFIFLAFFVNIFITNNAQAATTGDDALCKAYNANFTCTDITTLASTVACQKNKCLGANQNSANVQCCPIDAPLKANVTTAGNTSTGTNFGPAGSTSFTNPLGFKTVEEFLGGIMAAIQRIIVVLALVFIMIGAVMYVVSGGDKAMVDKAKGSITMALIGLALGVAAPSLLKELAAIIGWGGAGAVAGALTLTQIAMNVLKFLLGTMGIVALVMMVIGAILYLTSAGDSDRISKGKDIFKYSVIGVALAMSAMVLVTQIAKFFQ